MIATESSPTVIPQLPDPRDNPRAIVVIYDGHCRMCMKQVTLLARLDRRRRLAFLSLFDPRAQELCPDLTQEQMLQAMLVIPPNGKRRRGADAVRFLSRQLPALWWMAPWLHFPGSLPFWEWCYGWVARNRYWFGGQSACDDEACGIHQRK